MCAFLHSLPVRCAQYKSDVLLLLFRKDKLFREVSNPFKYLFKTEF
mgnify:CR=1 FL=1